MSVTRKLALAQIRRSPRRILAIALSALLSAMAIMATGTFIETLSRGLAASIAAPFSSADAVLVHADDSVDVDKLESVPGVEAAAPSVDAYGRLHANDNTFDLQLHSLPDDEALRWVQLDDGRWPQATNEVLTTNEHLKRFNLQMGDTVSFEITPGEILQATVVGTVTTPAPLSGMPWFVAPTEFITQTGVPAANYIIRGSVSPQELAQAVNSQFQLDGEDTDGMHALTVQQHVNDQIDRETGSTGALAFMLTAFVMIAMLAAIMVTRNTFQVLLSQRMRENGLLRLVGATGGQVQRTVLVEAAVIGVVSALAGIAIGFGLGWLVASFAQVAGGGIAFSPWWALAALVATTVMTVYAAWAPAAGLRSLSPVAALGEAGSVAAERGGRKVVSWVIGGLLTVVGIVGIVLAATRSVSVLAGPLVFIASAAVLAAGLTVLVPLFVRVAMPAISAPLRAGGPVAKIAGENLVRTARRSGTVVLAIAFGGSLVLAMLTAVGGGVASFNKQMDDEYAVDAVLVAKDGESISRDTVAPIFDSKTVDAAEFSDSVTVTTTSESLPLTSLTTLPPSVESSLATPAQTGEVLVNPTLLEDAGMADGDTITVRGESGQEVSLRVRAAPAMNSLGFVNADAAMVGAVDAATLGQLGDVTKDSRLWIQAPADASNELAAVIDGVRVDNPSLTLDGPLTMQQLFAQGVTMVVTFVLAMLALTVIIAGLGLASIVALAVGERRREIALLRALGTSRVEIRRMVMIEAIMLALTGALLSIIIGIPLGVAAVPTIIPEGSIGISIPWLGIAAVVIVAVLIGVLAGMHPARKAARVAPAQALARE